MCGIFCSSNKMVFNSLYELNKHRGHLNKVSVLSISLNDDSIDIIRDSIDNIELEGNFNIGHIQSPTNQIKNESGIQPVCLDNNILIHNGMLKQSYIKTQSIKYKTTFDTLIMINMINEHGIKYTLSEIDGSFACILYYNEELYVFRNNSGILYIDDKLNISSTKFKNSNLLPENVIMKLDIHNTKLIEVGTFKSKSSPYFIF